MMHADNIEMPMECKFSGYVHLFGRYVHLDETFGSGEAGSHFRLKIDDRSRCVFGHTLLLDSDCEDTIISPFITVCFSSE